MLYASPFRCLHSACLGMLHHKACVHPSVCIPQCASLSVHPSERRPAKPLTSAWQSGDPISGARSTVSSSSSPGMRGKRTWTARRAAMHLGDHIRSDRIGSSRAQGAVQKTTTREQCMRLVVSHRVQSFGQPNNHGPLETTSASNHSCCPSFFQHILVASLDPLPPPPPSTWCVSDSTAAQEILTTSLNLILYSEAQATEIVANWDKHRTQV